MKMLIVIIALSLVFLGLNNIAHAQNSMPVIAEFFGEHFDSTYGYSMVSLDFNHDGYDDLAVCSMSYGYVSGQSVARGKVYIYYGGPGFSSDTQASVTLEGDCTSSNSGRRIWAIYKIGDVSGDGFDDLCVRVEDYGESMKLLIFYGGTHGLNTPGHVIVLEGYTVVYPLSDINGDGYGDIGICYKTADQFQLKLSIIWGGTYAEQAVSQGEGSYSYSFSITGIGDINNDGFGDFASGFAVTNVDVPYNLIRVYYGNAQGDTSNPVVLIQISGPISRISYPLGDINGDGYYDFMGYGTNYGMDVWLGGANLDPPVPDVEFTPPRYAGVVFGDLNGDGFDDVAGSDYYARYVSVWLGKQNANGTEDLNLHQNYENFGYQLCAGDFNADGFDDIAVAAPDQYGHVWVYGGNAQLADTTVANDDLVSPEPPVPLRVIISPNPVSAGLSELSLCVKTKARNSQGRIDLYNVKGQRLLTKTIDQSGETTIHILALPKLPAGVYLCRLKVGQSKATARFCVIR